MSCVRSRRRTWILPPLVLALAAAGAADAARPANDYLFVLNERAGPYRYLAQPEPGVGDFPPAVAAFGRPSTVGPGPHGGAGRGTGADIGLAVSYAGTLSCSERALAHPALWYGMSLFGRRWHTTRGVHVGQSEAA